MIAIRIATKATMRTFELRWVKEKMTERSRDLSIWLVDPISYSGMSYSDVGQVKALREIGVQALVVGSDNWMLDDRIVPRITVFRGTSGRRHRLARGAAYVVSVARLLRRVRRAKPTIVHWQYTELPVVDASAMLALRILRVRQVYTAHELLPWTARWYHRWLFRLIYSVVDAIVVHDEARASDLVRRFKVPRAKVYVVPLGDYAAFAAPELPQTVARARIGLDPDVPVALFFGTIRPAKGLDLLLNAWGDVVGAVPGAVLVIAGKPYKGLDVGAIDAAIDSLGIRQSVHAVFEQVDPVAANDFYRASDVVVLPYLAIGTSGVLRYAFNSARPVIATNVGEHPMHVEPGATGVLIPPERVDLLASALIECLRDRAALQALGENARAYAAQRLSWAESACSLRTLYGDVAAQRFSK